MKALVCNSGLGKKTGVQSMPVFLKYFGLYDVLIIFCLQKNG